MSQQIHIMQTTIMPQIPLKNCQDKDFLQHSTVQHEAHTLVKIVLLETRPTQQIQIAKQDVHEIQDFSGVLSFGAAHFVSQPLMI